MVGSRVRIRDEQRWPAGRRDFPDGPARSGDNEIGCGQRGAELVREGEEAVVVAPGAPVELGEVPFPGEVEHGRPLGGEGVQGGVVQTPGALAAPEDQHDGPCLR